MEKKVRIAYCKKKNPDTEKTFVFHKIIDEYNIIYITKDQLIRFSIYLM